MSHLAGGAAAAAAALESPSLLLYVGLAEVDLISVAEEEGDGEAGLEVDDRPSMLPEHRLPVSAAGRTFTVWKLWGKDPVRAGELVWERQRRCLQQLSQSEPAVVRLD